MSDTMSGPERVRVFHEAVEILLVRQVQRTKPTNPDGYITRTRGLKRHDFQAAANEIMDEFPGIDAHGLAELLEPEPPSATPEPVNPSALLPNVDDVVPPWTPLPPDERQRAREHIAAIRENLKRSEDA